MSNPETNDTAAIDLLVQAARTDRDALGALFDRYFLVIHRYCYRRSWNQATADDVAAEVFLQVAEAIHGFAGQTDEDFRRWLYRIATNAINAHQRKTARRVELLETAARLNGWLDQTTALETNSDWQVEWSCVAQAMKQLSDRDQTLLTLYYLESLDSETIAELMDLRPGTVRVAISRALTALRSYLARPTGDESSRPTRPAQ